MTEREYPETGWALRHAAREQEEDYAREEAAERERIHAREAMHRRADRGGHDWPCRHGHTFCATSDGGACFDELMTEHEEADPGCPLCAEGRE